MRKLALLSLIAAGCSSIAGVSIAKGNVEQVNATDSYPSWYPKNYGSLRRLIINSTNDNIISINSITVDGKAYNAKSGHVTSYSDDSRYNYFDVPSTASSLSNMNISTPDGNVDATSCDFTSQTIPDSFKVLSFTLENSSELIAKPAKYRFTNISWTTNTPTLASTSNLGSAIATSLEGCYSCSSSTTNGYGALSTIEAWYDECTTKITVDKYLIDDISGFEVDDGQGGKTSKCTVAAKMATMRAKRSNTYGALTSMSSSSSTANSYLWVIAIAGTAAIVSIATVTIATSKKKQKKEN